MDSAHFQGRLERRRSGSARAKTKPREGQEKHMKKLIHIRRVAAALCAFASAVATASATSLTFDIYTNAAKTITPSGSPYMPQSYGDNVTDFDPAGLFTAPFGGGSFYGRYGTNGGYTPGVT